MNTWRVLVTRHVYPEALELLREHAIVDYRDSAEGLAPTDLCAALAGVQAVVSQLTDPIDARVIDAAADLEIIANIAVGYDNIDVAAARRRGVVVTNTPGVLTESTADLAFALLLATARRLTEAERFLRDGRWRRWEVDLLCGQDVHGRVLGILGFGRIGRAMATRARGFGMRVLYHNPRRLDPAMERGHGVAFATREELLASSDFVSLHAPLNQETRHLIGPAELDLLRPTAILINTARGGLVDEDALIEALRSRRIAGAGLDVFADEPAVDPRLLALDNVVLLPHIGSASVATRTRMCCIAAENVVACIRGQPPPNPV